MPTPNQIWRRGHDQQAICPGRKYRGGIADSTLPHPGAAQRLRRICVVEDDADIRLYMAIVLERAGFETVAYDNGLSAFDAAQEAPADLFVLDRRMPGMDGEQLCRALRADPRTGSCPIMMISAETVDLAAAAGDAGADAYLPKPFSRTELLAAVGRLLGEASERTD